MSYDLRWTDETVYTDAELDDMASDYWASKHPTCESCPTVGCIEPDCDCEVPKLKRHDGLDFCAGCLATYLEEEDTEVTP